MKNIIPYMSGLVLLSFLLCIFIFAKKNSNNIDFSCSSSMSVYSEKKSENPIFNMTQSISLYSNNSGVIYASGELNEDGRKYIINRTAKLDYSKIGSNDMEARIVEVVKTSRDDVPKMLEEKYIAALTSDAVRIINIRKMESGDISFSFTSGPYFICARL